MRSNREAWDSFAPRHRSTLPLDFAPLLRSAAPAGPILEIGCGYGRVMAYLAESGWTDVVGIDHSTAMLARARRGGHRQVVLAQADRLPFESTSFAAVVAIAAFSSLGDPGEREASFHEIARVLTPGGVLLLRDFGLTLHGWRLIRYVWQFPRFRIFGDFRSAEGIRFHHFRRGEVRRLGRAAGFQVLSERQQTFTTMHGRASNGFTVLARKVSASDELAAAPSAGDYTARAG